MCMGKANQETNNQQTVATLFLPLLLHLHMGVCVPLVHVCPRAPCVGVPMCVPGGVAYLGCRADSG